MIDVGMQVRETGLWANDERGLGYVKSNDAAPKGLSPLRTVHVVYEDGSDDYYAPDEVEVVVIAIPIRATPSIPIGDFGQAIVAANGCLAEFVCDKKVNSDNNNDLAVAKMQVAVGAVVGAALNLCPVYEYQVPEDTNKETFDVDIAMLRSPALRIGMEDRGFGYVLAFVRKKYGASWGICREATLERPCGPRRPWVAFDTQNIRMFVHFKCGVRSLNKNAQNLRASLQNDLIRLQDIPVPQLSLTLYPRDNPRPPGKNRQGWEWGATKHPTMSSFLARHEFAAKVLELSLPFTIDHRDEENWMIAEYPDYTSIAKG